MRFPSPLIHGALIQRYKRFLADVRLASGETSRLTARTPGA
jgi:sugar fermentation stimulation protein A